MTITRACDGERREVEVAERLDGRTRRAARALPRAMAVARARVRGEDDRLVDARRGRRRSARAGLGRRSPRGGSSRRRTPPARAEPLEDVRALARDRREAKATRRPSRRRRPRSRPPTPSARERRARALVGAEEQRREPVDLDPVSLLRHRRGRRCAAPPRRARPARRPPRPPARRRASSSCRRRRAPSRAARRRRPSPDGGARIACDVRGVQVEPVARLGQPELLEEDLRELAVLVLSRVHDDLLDALLAQRHRERRGLDELRPVADDREHLHGA